jgi:ABC-type transport system involved in multi-copper enzyme maturation permease subunit
MPPAATLARLVLLEARRGGLPWLAAGCIALGVGLGAFLSQVALTESRELQLALVAAWLRACAVFLIAAHVATRTVREIDDKALELMLALPLARATHYLGRLAGLAACGALLATVFALPLLLWAAPGAVAAWAVSLAFELALVAATALFFAMTLVQPVPAIAATAGLYLLGRSITALQVLAGGGPLADASVFGQLARGSVAAVAFLLPRLDEATRTEWLLYGAPAAAAYGAVLGGLLLYIVILAAAGLFDFERKNV